MARPNRGYIFEAVWAAAVAAKFYKRIGDIEKIKTPGAFQKSVSNRILLGTLPLINDRDVQNMLIQIWNSGKKLARETQNDISFKSIVKDYLVVDVKVPTAVDKFISKMVKTRNFNEIADFIRSSTAVANNHTGLQSKVKSVAFNGFVDNISILADGVINRTLKADVVVNIVSEDPKTKISSFLVSCKVPGGEQFAQISGLEFDKFVSLFSNLGLSIPDNLRIEWENSVSQFINEGVFEKRYATIEAIKQTKAPEKTRKAAIKVYNTMGQQMQVNFPTEAFADFVYRGFSGGVDTEVIKLVQTRKSGNQILVGAKTITVDQKFRELLTQQNYNVSYSGSIIRIYASGVPGHIMQFRYRWENPSTERDNVKTYKMYARHLLESGPGMFKLDPRSQEFKPR